MSSGVIVAVKDASVAAFQALRANKAYRYVIYKLDETNTAVVVEHLGQRDATYEDFLAQMPQNDCRYAVYDLEYTVGPNEGIRNRICFYMWCPEGSKTQEKMHYSSSKEAVKGALRGATHEVQATDESELLYDNVVERIRGRGL